MDKQNMERRTLFYWAQMYLMNLKRGDTYQDLKPAITINLLRYNLFSEDAVHSMYSIYNMETKRRLNEDMELHFLEIPKFKKRPVHEMTRMERWIAYFSNALDKQEMEELAMQDTAIQTALDASILFMQNDDERLQYINREMAVIDYESDKEAWMSKGRAEGRMEGRIEGRAEGRMEGRIEGRAEGIDDAMRMLLSMGKISSEDVDAIKQKMKDK